MPIIQSMNQLTTIPANTRYFKVSYAGKQDDNFPKNGKVEVDLTTGGQIQSSFAFSNELQVVRIPDSGTFNSSVKAIENLSVFAVEITFS